MTTMGYGDHYPVTFVGKRVAVLLMIGGIGPLGTVTATLASWLVDKVREEGEAVDDAARQLARLEDQLTAVQSQLGALQAALGADDRAEPRAR